MNDDNIINTMIEKIDNIKNILINIKIKNNNDIEVLNNITFIINKLNSILLDYTNNTNDYTYNNNINNNNIDDKIYNIYLPYILYTQLITIKNFIRLFKCSVYLAVF
jgi:hypothetical protein